MELFDIHLAIVNYAGEYIELLPDNIKVHNLNTMKTVFSLFKLRNIIKTISPDMVYSTLFNANIILKCF